MGVDVARYKAAAFTISSMYAGLAGVLLALIFGRIVPNTFDFAMSIDFLVMIVLGGLGSVGGAAIGAVFVTVLPQLFDHYSGSLPLVSEPGGSLEPSQAARILFGAAVVAVLIFQPGGLAGLRRRWSRWRTCGRRPRPHPFRRGEERRWTMNARFLRVTVAALVTSMSLGAIAACGKSESGEEQGDVKAGPGVTAKAINVGILTDLSGTFAALGKPIVQATQLYWKQQNASGGVCGREVNLVVKDHGYNPQRAVTQYRESSPTSPRCTSCLDRPWQSRYCPRSTRTGSTPA